MASFNGPAHDALFAVAIAKAKSVITEQVQVAMQEVAWTSLPYTATFRLCECFFLGKAGGKTGLPE